MLKRNNGTLMKARLPVWRRLGWRVAASFLFLTALGILLSGFLQYRAQDLWLRQSLGSLLLNIARTGALLVDGDLHQRVVETRGGDTAGYEMIRAQLQRIQEANRLGDPVYTLSDIEKDRARFSVISHGQEPVGKQYQLAPGIRPILTRVLTAGVPAYTDIYFNEHGTWITAFAPIQNGAGQTVAVLDVDFRADVYLEQLAAVRRRFYLHSLAGALLALVAGVLLARQIIQPVTQLSALARRVVEGDFSARVRITARDEIGLLGNAFHLMVERVHVSHRSMIDVLVRALEARERDSGSLTRLASAALAMADHLELSRTQREALQLGALLHDIGEIRTPEALLKKVGPLTGEERRVIEEHPACGADILEAVPLLTPALDVVSGHHERYDGGGYPQGLRGEEIPLTARIFAVVDTLDAMTHDRPYRPARPLSVALEVLKQESGKQFDPRVVEAAMAIPPARWAELLACQETI